MANAQSHFAAGNVVYIKKAEPANVQSMAQCHISCFPRQFTSRMGKRFVQAFYEIYLSRDDGLACVAVEQKSNRVVGVIIGGSADIRSDFLRQAAWRFFATLIFKCVVDRVVRSRVINRLTKKLIKKNTNVIDEALPDWPCKPAKNKGLLQLICVLEDYRGTSVAKNLFEAFQRACQEAGYSALNLSVASNNARAIAFYLKMGWKVIAEKPGAIRMEAVISNHHH